MALHVCFLFTLLTAFASPMEDVTLLVEGSLA